MLLTVHRISATFTGTVTKLCRMGTSRRRSWSPQWVLAENGAGPSGFESERDGFSCATRPPEIMC